MIILLIITYSVMFLWQGPRLMKKKYRREFWAFVFFWALALTFNSLQVLGVKLVNPSQIIQYFIEDVLRVMTVIGSNPIDNIFLLVINSVSESTDNFFIK